MTEPIVDCVAFEGPNRTYLGWTVRASWLKEPHQKDALVEIFRDGNLVRKFYFPAYKIFNIQAHFEDIVQGELNNSDYGYQLAGWCGLGNIVAHPFREEKDVN